MKVHEHTFVIKPQDLENVLKLQAITTGKTDKMTINGKEIAFIKSKVDITPHEMKVTVYFKNKKKRIIK